MRAALHATGSVVLLAVLVALAGCGGGGGGGNTPYVPPTTGKCSISVSSTPTGASILLDGSATRFTTPHVFEGVTAGSHTVELRLTGYQSAKSQRTVSSGTRWTLNVPLVVIPPTTCSISVASTPSGASILLNGSATGFTTPHLFQNLPPGSWTVELRREGAWPWGATKAISAGQRWTINQPMWPCGLGWTAVWASPAGYGRITIDWVDTSDTWVIGASNEGWLLRWSGSGALREHSHHDARFYSAHGELWRPLVSGNNAAGPLLGAVYYLPLVRVWYTKQTMPALPDSFMSCCAQSENLIVTGTDIGAVVEKDHGNWKRWTWIGYSVAMRDADTVGDDFACVVGDRGLVSYRRPGTGGDWAATAIEGVAQFNGVDFADTRNGWACGSGGAIYRTTNGGPNWSAQSSGTKQFLRTVRFVSANEGWAGGDGGAMLYTADGGAHWAKAAIGSPSGGLGASCSVNSLCGLISGGTVLMWASVYDTSTTVTTLYRAEGAPANVTDTRGGEEVEPEDFVGPQDAVNTLERMGSRTQSGSDACVPVRVRSERL